MNYISLALSPSMEASLVIGGMSCTRTVGGWKGSQEVITWGFQQGFLVGSKEPQLHPYYSSRRRHSGLVSAGCVGSVAHERIRYLDQSEHRFVGAKLVEAPAEGLP